MHASTLKREKSNIAVFENKALIIETTEFTHEIHAHLLYFVFVNNKSLQNNPRKLFGPMQSILSVAK